MLRKQVCLARNLLAAGVALFMLVSVPCKADTAKLQGPGETWRSPDGTMSIVWRYVGNDGEPTLQHALMLEQPGKKPALLELFGRYVDVFWSPDSRHIAVTDYAGSNIAESFLVDIGSSGPSRRYYVSPHLSRVEAAGHAYYCWIGWLDTNRIAMRVLGHTDTNPSHQFAYSFTYDLITKTLKSSKLIRDSQLHP
jgi:hypothetical protein